MVPPSPLEGPTGTGAGSTSTTAISSTGRFEPTHCETWAGSWLLLEGDAGVHTRLAGAAEPAAAQALALYGGPSGSQNQRGRHPEGDHSLLTMRNLIPTVDWDALSSYV